MKIGVLALQGAVSEHLEALHKCGVEAVAVKKVEQLDGLDGLIIPGGESTTIGLLMQKYGFDRAIESKTAAGFPIYGTCAGMILLAERIIGYEDQFRLGLIDMDVVRNSYGRQRESFEADLKIPVIGEEPFRGVFIRAPHVESVGPNAEVLCEHEGRVVLVRQGPYLASSFHPELTDDLRLHRYFINMVTNSLTDGSRG